MTKKEIVKKFIFNGVLPLAAGIIILCMVLKSEFTVLAAVIVFVVGIFKSPFLVFGNPVALAISLLLCVVLGWAFTLIWIVKGLVLFFVYGVQMITYKVS